MKKLSILLLIFVGTLFAHAGNNERFKYADITSPDFFPILPWDPLHDWGMSMTNHPGHPLESALECHFNMAGFVEPGDLALCKKLNLGAIMLPMDPARAGFEYFTQWRKLSDAQIDRRVKDMVRAAGKSPAIMGYFITDEPGITDFPALAKAVAAVKRYAPGKWAYINLFPDYATLGAPNMSQLGTSNYTEYLERFIEIVHPQALSYDNYMVQFSMDLENGQQASYYRNLLEVRRVGLKHHLPYINIIASSQILPDIAIPSPANLSWQAYTTLAAGYRGVTWYTYFNSVYHYAPLDASGNKTLTWSALCEVNRQTAALAPIMSRLTSTGVFFTEPVPVAGLPLLPGRLVTSATSTTPLMIGEFKSESGQSYLMVVNLSLERTGKFTLNLAHPIDPISLFSTSDNSFTPFNQSNGCWLPAGQGILLRVGK